MTNCIDKKQTMKRINDIIAMVGQVVMASCSPRVVADLDMMLPPRTADSLMIYEAADSMPAGAVKIGTVKTVKVLATKRARLLKKIFGIEGGAETFDQRIREIFADATD